MPYIYGFVLDPDKLNTSIYRLDLEEHQNLINLNINVDIFQRNKQKLREAADLHFKIQGCVLSYGQDRMADCDSMLKVLSMTYDGKHFCSHINLQTERRELEKKESSILVTYIKSKQIVFKGYNDGRIEKTDKNE